jgi:hypothetical protein
LADFQQYAQNHGYIVARNDNTVQAIRNEETYKTGIVFYAAATVDLGNGLIVTADKPALVLIEQDGANYQLSVADPKYSATSVSLTFNKRLSGVNVVNAATSSTITFSLPTGDYTGSSVTNRYTDIGYNAISQPEKQEETIVVYPNPAKNHTSVGVEAGKFSFLEMYSIDGHKLFGKPIAPNDTSVEIPLAFCSAGSYIIKLNGYKNSVIKKLLVL